MLAGIALEKFSEVGAACREDHFMSCVLLIFAGQCHIDEVLLLLEAPECGEYAVMVVVPPEVVLVISELHFVFCLMELHRLLDPILSSTTKTKFLGCVPAFYIQFV